MFWLGLGIGIAAGVCFMLFAFNPVAGEILAGVKYVAELLHSLHRKFDAAQEALKETK